MTNSVRDQFLCRPLFETLRKTAPFSQLLLVTTMPRGGLQLAQPVNAPESIVKTYSRTIQGDDRPAWNAMTDGRPVRVRECWSANDFKSTVYYRELLGPLNAEHAIVLPVRSPVLEGYPGAILLARQENQPDFTDSEINKLYAAVQDFDEHQPREADSLNATDSRATILMHERPLVSVVAVNSDYKPHLLGADWAGYDDRLREQMVTEARRRSHMLNGDGQESVRVLFPDSHGDIWTFRVATYRSYPALGSGTHSLFCLTPTCDDWGRVKQADFQADPEVARLIPALKFMLHEFHRGPTLGEIAKQVQLSPFHFHRRFTELLGLTPKQYMLECQIHEAKTQLLAIKDLAGIARDCGFAHQSHFTSRFKQATGLTPTRWRRMMQNRAAVAAPN